MARGGRRAGAGRPAKPDARRERVWARIRPELLDEIERIAESQGRSPAELLTRYIETGLMVWAEDRTRIMTLIYDHESLA